MVMSSHTTVWNHLYDFLQNWCCWHGLSQWMAGIEEASSKKVESVEEKAEIFQKQREKFIKVVVYKN